MDLTISDLLKILEEDDVSSLLELLLKNKSKWNKIIRKNKELKQRIFLNGLDLKKKDLSNLDFSGVEILNTDMSGANLKGVNFTKSTISQSNLSYSSMQNSTLYLTHATQSSFAGANMYNASIGRLYFTGSVDLHGTTFRQVEDYSTSEEVTKRGFRDMPDDDHSEEEDGDNERSYY